jgi:hypothetical protein
MDERFPHHEHSETARRDPDGLKYELSASAGVRQQLLQLRRMSNRMHHRMFEHGVDTVMDIPSRWSDVRAGGPAREPHDIDSLPAA